ncbi:hypothetical protein [Flavobacterium psychrotrophum]|uniref:hypothetical protein n=1 Tax=Flavobacterium psychrotrophum TaxID=2294119 RepID=UPI000E31A427|nr:hypothetical protein [Flavobacterium psychrotrophum]
MRYFYFIIALCFLSCKKDTDNTTISVVEEQTTQDTTSIKRQDFDIEWLEKSVAQFKEANDKIKIQVNTATPQQANTLYDKLIIENNELIGKISEKEANLLDEYYTHFSGTNNDKPDQEVKIKSSILEKTGLEIWEIGEGVAEVRTVPDYYKNIFSDKVTKDYKAYIDILAEDDKTLYQADAAINISWQDLGKRLINWENFTLNYPESNLIEKGTGWYKLYQDAYLNGYDNTPTSEHDSDKLYPEIKEAFEEFITSYPLSPTTPYIKQLLEGRNNLDAINTELHFKRSVI